METFLTFHAPTETHVDMSRVQSTTLKCLVYLAHDELKTSDRTQLLVVLLRIAELLDDWCRSLGCNFPVGRLLNFIGVATQMLIHGFPHAYTPTNQLIQ